MSLAMDLGLGQPMEHMLRACLLGVRLCDRLQLPPETHDRVFAASLLSWVGCQADSPELSALFGDDIAFRSATYRRDAKGVGRAQLMLGHVAADKPPIVRGARAARFAAVGRPQVVELVESHWSSARTLSGQLGLAPEIGDHLGFLFERWDGGGIPQGARGDEIPLDMRIVQLTDTLEVFLRKGGEEAATSVARARRATQFDPALVDAWCRHAGDLCADLDEIDVWSAVLERAPDEPLTSADDLDRVLTAMGDFADLRSAYTAGHSRAVADLGMRASDVAGLDPVAQVDVRRAGLVHDLGRLGVSATVWNKTEPLTAVEAERVRLHPYLTERILSRVPALAGVAALAGSHHERLDGSGYTRGLTADALDARARILAASDCYCAWREPRPHRPALTTEEVHSRLEREVSQGRLDGAAVESVLVAAGHGRRSNRMHPGGLTARELEVLRLLVRGMSSRDIATRLVIVPKTARNHVEHIYTKLGISNRVGATLFAVQHGLIDPDAVDADAG